MKNKILIFTLILTLITGTISTAAYKYEAPYDGVTVDEKLLENMPVPYSLDNTPKRLVASCDFNERNESETLKKYLGSGYWSSADGAYKVVRENAATENLSIALKYESASGFDVGETYAFVCRVKEINTVTNGGTINTYVDVLNGSSVINEYNQPNKSAKDANGWYTATISFEIKKNATALTLNAIVTNAVTGTILFDDFFLYKLGGNPLETVLVTPSYKGLIYGNDYTDINLDVLVYDRGGFFNLSELALSVTLKNASDETIYCSESDTVTEKMNFVFPSASLAEGDYYLRATLYDKETDEEISYKENTIRKRSASYRPEVYVDENGHLVTDGEKTFFKGLYNSDGNYQESYEFAKETGFPSIFNYGMSWWSTNNENATLESMRQDGISTTIALNAYLFSLRSQNGNQAMTIIGEQADIPKFLKEFTDDYKEDDILSGYFLFDEPDPYTLGEEIRWNNEILASLDIDRPTFGVADKEYSKYGIYTRMADILQYDVYPITGKTDSNGKSTDDIAKIGRSMRLLKKNFPLRPVHLVQQGFKYSHTGDAVRPPSYDELRNMAWQAICEGAEGIEWYSFHEMVKDKIKPLTQWEDEIKTLNDEISSYENAILSDEPCPEYTVSGGGAWLNTMVRRYNGKTYLFAVNNTYETKTADIRVQGLKNRSLTFAPLEVKIFSDTQDSVLSNRDELLSLGFSKGNKVFPMAELDGETLIYVPENCSIIDYTAFISEEAKLIIGTKEVPLKGRITVDGVDTFKVYVVSENDKKATNHNYRVVRMEDN